MMVAETLPAFGPFALDLDNRSLRRGGREVPLTPKSWAVLRHLLERRGKLVRKDELLQAVWPDTIVVDAVLKVAVLEIRKALGDDPKAPLYIETLHRRGYRFRAEDAALPTLSAAPPPAPLAGRDAELQRLRGAWDRALSGQRTLVLITGEAGIGKTALVEHFVAAGTAAAAGALVARGQSLEQFGAAEPYQPVLEALGRLGRTAPDVVVPVLRRMAPTWLLQLPWLLPAAELQALQREVFGATRDRMLREIAEALEALSQATPLVLWIDDLHWSDAATLALLATLARRSEPARLLVLGTCRLPETARSRAPLTAVLDELRLHRLCVELPLGSLDRAAVVALLQQRFPGAERQTGLLHWLYEHTDGHPLFMVALLEDLAARGVLDRNSTGWQLSVPLAELSPQAPQGIRQLLLRSLEALEPADRELLEVTSLCAQPFATAAVAAALGQDPLAVEERCQALSQRDLFLRPTEPATWPDGTVTARFRFRHALYPAVLQEQVAPVRAARLHRALGDRLIQGFGARAAECASELSVHFAAARDFARAIRFLQEAAHKATRRFANAQAAQCLRQALRLSVRLPEEQRAGMRRELLLQLGSALRSLGAMQDAATQFEALADEAHATGDSGGEAHAALLAASALSWVDRDHAARLAARAESLLPRLTGRDHASHVRGLSGYWHLVLHGWRSKDFDRSKAAVAAARKAGDQGALSERLARHCYFLCLSSRYDAASHAAEEAKGLARGAGNVFDFLLAHFFQAWALLHGGQWGTALHVIEDGLRMAESNAHVHWIRMFRLQLAWLHEHAFDFTTAKTLCEAALADACAVGHHYGEMVGGVLLGYVRLGLGDVDGARRQLQTVQNGLQRRRVLMDWIWRIPLHHGLGECAQLAGDLQRAELHSRSAAALAAAPGERHFQALALRRLAEIAWHRGDRKGSVRFLRQALDLVRKGDVPLAAWRVHATAARLCAERDEPATAARHLAARDALRRRLLDSLAEAPALRRSFAR
jgi:DNA-binding winged helix-turn-helix (wHTH) protein